MRCMSQKQDKINYIITSAIIAACYVALTFISNLFGLAYGPIQLRISEVLTILPVFTSAAIPGLAIGCFISNFASFNILDIFFGTFATLAAAILTYMLRNIKFKKIPLLAFFPPVIINALIIGLEISVFFLPEGFTLYGFIISGLEVGAGQLIVCYALGIPAYIAISKYGIFKSSNK